MGRRSRWRTGSGPWRPRSQGWVEQPHQSPENSIRSTKLGKTSHFNSLGPIKSWFPLSVYYLFPLSGSSLPSTPSPPSERSPWFLLPRNLLLLSIPSTRLGLGGLGLCACWEWEVCEKVAAPFSLKSKAFHHLSPLCSWQAAWASDAFTLSWLARLDCVLQTLLLYRLEEDKSVRLSWALP